MVVIPVFCEKGQLRVEGGREGATGSKSGGAPGERRADVKTEFRPVVPIMMAFRLLLAEQTSLGGTI